MQSVARRCWCELLSVKVLHAGFPAWCGSRGNSGTAAESMGARGAQDGGVTGSYCWSRLEVMGVGSLEQ